MDAATLERLFALLAASPGVRTLDLTGGAPELHPLFRGAVARAAGLGLRVLVRSNLTVLLEPGQEDLATFLASHRVRVVASLPCYEEGAVDAQRGAGVYARSITALQALNAAGYATPGTGLHLDLMYNPAGATLPPPQAALEAAYRAELRERHGVAFTRLLTLTNMPIKRFADRLHQSGQAESYLRLLLSAFNVATLPGLMCTNLVSVDWRGRLYDCDFNQALGLGEAGARDVWSLESLDDVAGSRVATGLHCLGCTAGAGSSCGGQLA